MAAARVWRQDYAGHRWEAWLLPAFQKAVEAGYLKDRKSSTGWGALDKCVTAHGRYCLAKPND